MRGALWRGPHLPDGRPKKERRAPADPANGERVPRCRTCGLPDREENHLTTFELRFEGRHAGFYVLCERDFYRANPPPQADPLDVQTA